MPLFLTRGTFSVFGLFTSIFFVRFGCALQITSWPNPYTPGLHDQLSVTCITKGQAYCSREVMVIEIGKLREKPIAVMRKDVPSMGPNSLSHIKADGRIQHDSRNSYLTLIIDSPSAQDAGTYRCKTFYLDEDFQLQEDSAFHNVTIIVDDDKESIVSLLTANVSKLETSFKEQEDAMSRLERQVLLLTDIVIKQNEMLNVQHEQISKLNGQLKLFQDTVKKENEKEQQLRTGWDWSLSELNNRTKRQEEALMALKNRLDDQNIDIYTLKEKGSHHCVFSMRYDSKDVITKDSTLKFTQTIVNIGNAYDVKTGLFTAPQDGVYVFHLVVAASNQSGGHVNVSLLKNGVLVAKLYPRDNDSADQASVTVVLPLRAGDPIRPFVSHMSPGNIAWDYGSIFSGFLLQQV